MRLESLGKNVAFAYRSYRRQPGIPLTALVTPTLGIGACSAIVSVMNAVLLKPVPYPDPDRIVMVGTNTGASAPKPPHGGHRPTSSRSCRPTAAVS